MWIGGSKKQFPRSFVSMLVLSVITFSFMPLPSLVSISGVDDLKSGPYIGKLVFTQEHSDHILALLDNELDLSTNSLDESAIDTLSESENIEIVKTLRNGYGYISINCLKYPYNYPAFRRALAFAIDKEAIAREVWGNNAEPLDSLIPKINPFSIDGQLDYSYYNANVSYGNYLLDQAEFYDIDNDGFREAPDGSDLYVPIEVPQSSSIAIHCGEYVEAALTSLGINAECLPTDFYEYLDRIHCHFDYDIVFFGNSFFNFDVDWMAYEYWSEYVGEPFFNFPNFANATYDSWRDQLIHSTSYDDVYEAAIEMQKIWVYQCPEIVLYENAYYYAYRKDRFAGYVNDVMEGPASFWTCYNVYNSENPKSSLNQTLRIGTWSCINAVNFMVSSSCHYEFNNYLPWDTLFIRGPDGRDVPWLVEEFLIETHSDNADVQTGHTRFTFDIIKNASWTDGTPLTAEDIVFTLNYYDQAPGNPYGASLHDMFSAYTLTNYTMRVEFNAESYWHLHSIAYLPILPKHVFSEIGLEGWRTWNPDPNNEPLVSSGPFNFTSVRYDYVEMKRNSNYFFKPNWDVSTTYNQTTEIVPFYDLPLFSVVLTTSSLVIIIGVITLWFKEKNQI